MFREPESDVEHISFARKADSFPNRAITATHRKIANGIARTTCATTDMATSSVVKHPR
jgi:hypothetical protein